MDKENNKISNGVKNIFKKTLKFISSRFLYLVIGIFLAIGVTYVYATWDQAKTGGSGQLSEANWNELVTMIENKLDATISSRLAASSYITERGTDNAALASDYTAARATKLDNLNTTISSVYGQVDNSYTACFSLLRGLSQGTSCDGYWLPCPDGWTRVATNWCPLYGIVNGVPQGDAVLCNSVCCLPR